jgi:outer membrane protein OmpU
MNNLKKLGLSALAGSLVAVSAQAGEMSVSGAANVSFVTGETTTSGKSIGSDQDVAFTGTGELDNGWTFTMSTAMTDANAVSSSFTSLTMGSLGTVTFGNATGGASGKYDEEVPQAYEQTSDAQANSANLVGSSLDSNAIQYNSTSYDLEGGLSVSFDIDYTPMASDVAAADGGASTYTDAWGSGQGLGVTVVSDTGASFGIYGSERESTATIIDKPAAGGGGDEFTGVAYVKYANGPLAVGASMSYYDGGVATVSGEATTDAKVVGTAAGTFESTSMSIAYSVNDNLSLSYTNTEDEYNGGGVAAVAQETDALQVAYSMGGMSIKAYRMDTTNPAYDSDASDLTVTEITLGLAF